MALIGAYLIRQQQEKRLAKTKEDPRAVLKPTSFRYFRRFERSLLGKLARASRLFSPLLPAHAPIRCQTYECVQSRTDRRLFIFLPGLGDILEDYEFYGFIEAVRQSGRSADMVVADLHFGYYLRRTVIERLRNDIVLPARRNGYEEIDLVGISLGGLGSLYYAIEHPAEIRRLFLLAPYVGDQRIVREIVAAGGVRRWHAEKVAEHDYQRKLWRWLKSYGSESTLPELYLGYGEQDKFAPGNRLLGEVLAEGHVCTVVGSHNWLTWSRLWKILLSREATGRKGSPVL